MNNSTVEILNKSLAFAVNVSIISKEIDEEAAQLIEEISAERQKIEQQQKLQQTPCSTLREFVEQMYSHVMVMKSRDGLSDGDERYISGQELICRLVLQEIDKLSPVA